MRNLLFILLLTVVVGCNRNNENITEQRTGEPCGRAVQVNAKSFSTAEGDPFTITSASVSGDCLTVKIGASGCSSDWDVGLLHGISFAADALPSDRLRIVLSNKTGECAASFTKTFQFDLYPLRQKATDKVPLGISGHEGYYKTLEYVY